MYSKTHDKNDKDCAHKCLQVSPVSRFDLQHNDTGQLMPDKPSDPDPVTQPQ